MDDLISRQAAISEIVGMTTMGVEELVTAGDKEKFDWIKGLSDSLVKIINLPSAQPEIIRCKDCKHRNTDECPMYYEEWIEYDEGDGFIERDFIPHDRTVSDGFCFKGERREDE